MTEPAPAGGAARSAAFAPALALALAAAAASGCDTGRMKYHYREIPFVEEEENAADMVSKMKLFGNDAVTFDRIIRAKDQTYSFRKAIIQNELGRHLSLIYLAKSLGGGWKADSGK